MGLFNSRKKIDNKTIKSGAPLIVITRPASFIAEQYRTLRTNMQFARAGKKVKNVSITSANPGEGKSTVSANLAVTLANQGERTLLLDADMRRPTVHKTFGVSNNEGLSTYLSSDESLQDVVKPTKIDNLDVMTGGPVPPNPSELLDSSGFSYLLNQLDKHYDVVIVDTPPVNVASDAPLVASKVNGTVMVIPQGIARKSDEQEAIEQLRRVHANILGAVMNRHKIRKGGKYSKYAGYYGYNMEEK